MPLGGGLAENTHSLQFLRASGEMPKQTALPPTLPPRLITREAAAAYVCISPTTFDEMIRNGKMPRPRVIGERRKAWDVRALDAAIDNLPSDGDGTAHESWNDIDEAQASAVH